MLVAIWAAPALAGAGDPSEAVAAAAARVADAEDALQAARARGDVGIGNLGPAVEAYEAALSGLRAGVAAAGAREQALGLGLAARRQEIARLLGSLAAISRTPPPEPAMHPNGPLDAARASALSSRLTPALRAEASELSRAMSDIAAVRAVRAEAIAGLVAGLRVLADAQSDLADAVATSSPGADETESPSLALLARDSDTLTQLAAALAEADDSPAAPNSPDTAAMDWPVRGTVARRFDEPDAAGVRRPGILVQAPPLSLVRAPSDATVRYAGPFLEYGYVVVLEPDRDTMVVLAGLAHVQARTGAAVKRGDPLGMLGGRPLDVEEYVMLPLAETGAGGGETLYIEVRRGQGAIDPEPLFARKG